MKQRVGNFTLIYENRWPVSSALSFRTSYMDDSDLEGLMDDIRQQRWDTGIVTGPFTAQVTIPENGRVFSIHQARVGSRTLTIKRIG